MLLTLFYCTGTFRYGYALHKAVHMHTGIIHSDQSCGKAPNKAFKWISGTKKWVKLRFAPHFTPLFLSAYCGVKSKSYPVEIS